jgi:DNA replication protein DnaC
MLTGNTLLNELVDELNMLKLPRMAVALDELYHHPEFLEKDRMTLLAEIIAPEYQEKVSKTLNNRLKAAKLKGSPEELSNCIDSDQRTYEPRGITEVISSLDFIAHGYNICILGASDAGKSYLARALGIQACNSYNVAYFHCEEFLESMVALKEQDYNKFAKRILKYLKYELIILDDFLLHTITDEREIKILFELLEKRNEQRKSTIVCSQRDPDHWKAMILNDEVSANSIMKRATKHYTIKIIAKENQ